ncbi:MAG TPA: NAD(P)H-quinone oxidoreductase [Gammaproteobacteria bacterium]|jgi:putative PIG3 family NAD(P)H quinone oxidoreductase
MKAVVLDGFGGPEVLKIGDVAPPTPAAGQVLIRVAATSVNRPDLMQRQGRYPPPPGESAILGLEIAGTIAGLGANVAEFARGERVLALVGGGAYAELATAHAGHVLRMPERLSFAEAACLCEAYITAYMNLFMRAHLAPGESALVHGGGGGVGTAAIQLCKALNPTGRVFATASAAKLARIKELGVDAAIDYKSEDFAAVVLAATHDQGVDVILDHIGASTFAANLKALAVNGRLAIIATMGGREASLDLARLMIKRQTITGSVLRPRPIEEKAAIIAEFGRVVMPLFAAGKIKPVIHAVYALEEVAKAHRTMEANEHFGKVVLTVS